MNFSGIIIVIIALILITRIEIKSPSKKLKKQQVNSVYFVTGVQNYTNTDHIGRSRPWGYFFDLEEAKKDVINNCLDMAENNYYNYIVIEKIPEGILPAIAGIDVIQWYKYNTKTDKYLECEAPEWSKNIMQWGI